jgi:S1-C subfamily serine protease
VTEIVNIKRLGSAGLALHAYCVEFYALHVFVPWKSRLVSWLADDVDLVRFKSVMASSLKTSKCVNEESLDLLNEGRKLVYIYRDNASKPIAKIIIEKSDCLFPESNEDETSITNKSQQVDEPESYKPSEIFEKNNEAGVLVRSYDESGNLIGFGSGFNVHENGVIITNLHVVLSGGSYLDVKFPKHGTYENVYIAGLTDFDTDLAVLRIDGKDLPKVNITPSVPVKVGDRIYTISNPEGLLNTLSEGLVSAERIVDNTTFYQVTAPISEGSSGGAVFNELGEVIGVASRVMKEGQNLNFAISIGEFEKIEKLEEYFTLKDLMDYLKQEKGNNP